MIFTWETDGWIIAMGVLCALSCSLLGNYLVLRKMSMMGDAISHAVLPGLAGGFLLMLFLQDSAWISSQLPAVGRWLDEVDPRHPLVMLIGAGIVGLLTAFLTEWVHGLGRVDHGASMGVVFTTLFAVGLIWIEQAASDHRVDLDAGCVLYGSIEAASLDLIGIGGLVIPRAAVVLAVVLLLNIAFVAAFYKELKISSFDPALATTLGINARLMHYLLMAMVAITTVACFEAIGSILVIAMLIVPAAAAHLLTDRLGAMIIVSMTFGAAAAIAGHLAAISVPLAFGFQSTTTAGSMATVAGLLFGVVLLVAPRQGILSRMAHRRSLQRRILREDVLGLLYRAREAGVSSRMGPTALALTLEARPGAINQALRRLRGDGLVAPDANQLTERGRTAGGKLVRSHRLWETYLAQHTALPHDHLHAPAERLEHITDESMSEKLSQATAQPTRDPQGKSIPPK